MPAKLLITSTSFFDTPGRHQKVLADCGLVYERARGPLRASALIELIKEKGPFDGLLCGEDEVNSEVVEALAPQAKVISKYGVGIDKIDVAAAGRAGIVVSNTPGVNHRSVAELTFGLLLAMVRRIPEHNAQVHATEWRRYTGVELSGKTLGIIGVGRVGREVAIRAMAFGMNVVGFNSSWPKAQVDAMSDINEAFRSDVFSEQAVHFRHARDISTLLRESDFISLHMNLTRDNQNFLNTEKLMQCKPGVFIVNVSRAGLVDQVSLVAALHSGHVAGYGTDVLLQEPIARDDTLLAAPNVVITPHIGSRTVDSVERQGTLAVENVLRVLVPEAAHKAGTGGWPHGALCNLPRQNGRKD